MEFGELRPILSGLVGGLIAIWLCTALARWLPEVCNGKSVETLVVEHRTAIWCANILLILGLAGAMALFGFKAIESDDWRALGIGLGGGSLAALISLALFGTFKRSPLKEVYVAYAVSQKAPVFLVYGILICCMVSFFVAVSSFLA
jgi:hypothetical protein